MALSEVVDVITRTAEVNISEDFSSFLAYTSSINKQHSSLKGTYSSSLSEQSLKS